MERLPGNTKPEGPKPKQVSMTQTAAPAIVWFRHDLRLADNPALRAACKRGGPVLPLFIWAPEEEGVWQQGARWFWDTLVDADLANNTLGWQWAAGCGADAAPYFRIFNPVSQGEKFDPIGNYIRRWVPELGRLPDQWIHKPWQAPAAALVVAGIELGRSYPHPIVSHSISREVALEAYQTVRKPGTRIATNGCSAVIGARVNAFRGRLKLEQNTLPRSVPRPSLSGDTPAVVPAR